MIKAGILSDTHLSSPDDFFVRQVTRCFNDCQVIIHAGDLTSISILEAFKDKKVFGVHGNMCDASSYHGLPEKISFHLGNFTIGLAHGAWLGRNIEEGLVDLFPEADCLIYGHTHQAVCHRHHGVLIINPGTFRATGKYGAPGTIAILEASETLRCSLHEIPSSQ